MLINLQNYDIHSLKILQFERLPKMFVIHIKENLLYLMTLFAFIATHLLINHTLSIKLSL